MLLKAREAYKKALAWEVYTRVCAPAQKAFDEIRKPLYVEYQTALAPAEEQLKKVTAPFFREYEKARELAEKEFEEENRSRIEDGKGNIRELHKKLDKYLGKEE